MEVNSDPRECGCGFKKIPGAGRLPPHCITCHTRELGHNGRWPNDECIPCTDESICGHDMYHTKKQKKRKRKGSNKNNRTKDSVYEPATSNTTKKNTKFVGALQVVQDKYGTEKLTAAVQPQSITSTPIRISLKNSPVLSKLVLSVNEIDTLKKSFHNSINQLVEKESSIDIGTGDISLGQFKFDEKRILEDYVQNLKDIDGHFNDMFKQLLDDRKKRIREVEKRLLEEVSLSIRKEKNSALENFASRIKDMLTTNLSAKHSTLTTNVVDLSSEDESSSPDKLEVDEDEGICPICQGEFDSPVKLPCGHNYCHDCMYDYVKNKTEMVNQGKIEIQDLIIRCPTCRHPYQYFDEFDAWLASNDFYLNSFWIVK